MWWKRKKKEPKPDWRQEGIDKLIAFRKRGETFTYLGVTMMVTGHWDIRPNLYGIDSHPSLRCDYVDAHGVLHQCSFGLGELPILERENSDEIDRLRAERSKGNALPIVRRWKFRVEDPDGEGCYVGPDGKQDSECEWIGTDAEASAEAQRRAGAWENDTNGLCLRVVYESQGQVKANKDICGER